MERVITYAECVFRKFGSTVKRFEQLSTGPAARGLLRRCLAAKSRNPRALRQQVRLASVFLTYLVDNHLDLLCIDEWAVAQWLRGQAVLCKSRGASAYASLKWVEQAFGVTLHTGSDLVRSQRQPLVDMSRAKGPTAARCPSEEMVCR